MSDIKPVKKIPGQNDPIPNERSAEEVDALVLALLSAPDSESDVVKYFTDKLKLLKTEGVELTELLTQRQQEIQAIGKRLSAIMCEAGTYKKDLVEWHDRSKK
jgi:hypothetical protein